MRAVDLERTGAGFGAWITRRLTVACGATGLTGVFFLVLPLIQAITAPRDKVIALQTFDSTVLPPPPPPPPEEEPEEEPEPEEKPPEPMTDAPPLDLAQLELALSPGLADGWMSSDFALSLDTVGSSGEDLDALFSLGDLDQGPRATHKPSPTMNAKMRKAAPGTVWVIFIVNERGRVESPKIQSSTDPVFEKAALDAIKKWKFDPGKRNGKPVRSRSRMPFTFPK